MMVATIPISAVESRAAFDAGSMTLRGGSTAGKTLSLAGNPVDGASLDIGADGVAVTGRIAPTSTIDLPNVVGLRSRNAENNAWLDVLKANASDRAEIGPAIESVGPTGINRNLYYHDLGRMGQPEHAPLWGFNSAFIEDANVSEDDPLGNHLFSLGYNPQFNNFRLDPSNPLSLCLEWENRYSGLGTPAMEWHIQVTDSNSSTYRPISMWLPHDPTTHKGAMSFQAGQIVYYDWSDTPWKQDTAAPSAGLSHTFFSKSHITHYNAQYTSDGGGGFTTQPLFRVLNPAGDTYWNILRVDPNRVMVSPQPLMIDGPVGRAGGAYQGAAIGVFARQTAANDELFVFNGDAVTGAVFGFSSQVNATTGVTHWFGNNSANANANVTFEMSTGASSGMPRVRLTKVGTVNWDMRVSGGNYQIFANQGFSGVALCALLTTGDVGIKTASPTAPLDVNGDTFRLRTARTPASAGAAGNTGDICWDDDNIYVRTSAGWAEAALTLLPS